MQDALLQTVVEAQKVSIPIPPHAAGSAAAEPRLSVIEPPRGWQLINVEELWRYRELLYFFTWRDVKIRYKQTLLGAAWAVIQPFMMMIVFTIFLGRMAGVESGEFPYPVFVYAGLLPWTFFATAITAAGNSVVGSNHIISKVYFPRLAIPFASVGAAVVDFVIAFAMLLVLMLYYGIAPGLSLLLVPLLLVITAVAALGIGTLLAALNVAFRDFKYTIPFMVQLWMFATPTVYMHVETDAAPRTEAVAASETAPMNVESASDRGQLPAALKPLLQLNPLTGIIAFFRAAVLGGTLPWWQLGYSSAVVAVMFCVGVAYFRRVESSFADVI